MPTQEFYAALAGDPTVSPAGVGITFQVFRHEEDFSSNYNVQLYKYDYETGNPLESARFVLFERFDDKGEIDTEKDGPVHIYEEETRTPAITRITLSYGPALGKLVLW